MSRSCVLCAVVVLFCFSFSEHCKEFKYLGVLFGGTCKIFFFFCGKEDCVATARGQMRGDMKHGRSVNYNHHSSS